MHAADISNPARPLRFCSRWGQAVHEEFFAQVRRRGGGPCGCEGLGMGRRAGTARRPCWRGADTPPSCRAPGLAQAPPSAAHPSPLLQGDKEAALGLPVSFICDRARSSVPQSQLTFVEYVVRPCFRCAPPRQHLRLPPAIRGRGHGRAQLVWTPAQPPKPAPTLPLPTCLPARLPALCSLLAEFAPNFVERTRPHIEAALHYWQQQVQQQQAEQQQQQQQQPVEQLPAGPANGGEASAAAAALAAASISPQPAAAGSGS